MTKTKTDGYKLADLLLSILDGRNILMGSRESNVHREQGR